MKKTNMLGLCSSKLHIAITLVIATLCISHIATAQTNTAYGTDALKSNTTGGYNSAFGYQSLIANTAGNDNTASGCWALYSNNTGWSNTAHGQRALFTNTKGNYNTAIGDAALRFNSTGSYNTASGDDALRLTTTGSYNTGSGHGALFFNTDGSYNTAIGSNADVASNNLTNATAIGANAKVNASNAIQLGDNAVTKIYAGIGNTATLVAGGLQVTGGSPAAGKVLTSDANGIASWQTPASGGAGAGWGLTGNAGTVDGTQFIGTTDNVPLTIKVNNKKAGRLDANNAFYGAEAGMLNSSGGYGVAIGHKALYNNTTGDGNIAIGYQALAANTTGSHNIAIGYNANVALANLDNAAAIGENATVNASNKIRLGSIAVTEVETQFKYTTISDGRFKNNVTEQDVKGLDFIKKLRPVAYNFDTRKFQEHISQNIPANTRQQYMSKDFSASTAIRRSGFIAQEVEKAAQEVGYDFDGISKPQDASGNYSLAYSQFVVPLVKAVQEQQQIIEQLQQRLQAVEKIIASGSNTNTPATKILPEPAVEEVTLFPNPTTGIVTIKANYINDGMIEMMDMQGNIMQKTTFNNAKLGYQLNVLGYAKGVYTLNIIANNKKYTKKLVIQ